MDNVRRARESLHGVLHALGWAGADEAASGGWCIAFDEGGPAPEVVMAIDTETEVFLLLADLAVTATPAWVQQANWARVLGNFELDAAGGTLRFRLAVPFSGGELAAATIRHAIGVAMAAVEACAAEELAA